jgi:hypothetical protein
MQNIQAIFNYLSFSKMLDYKNYLVGHYTMHIHIMIKHKTDEITIVAMC